MKTHYNIVYFSSENVPPIVLKSSDDENFFLDFDGPYLEDNIYSNYEAVKDAGYGFFTAKITVNITLTYSDGYGELDDIRIDDICKIEPVFDLPEPPKGD